jgi:hypothetical protein
VDSKVDDRNIEPATVRPQTEVGKPWRPVMSGRGGGASGVVRARESRAHGDRRQDVGQHSLPEKRPVDAGLQADKAWLLGVQRKLYQRSRDNPDEAYRRLWGWTPDRHNLR